MSSDPRAPICTFFQRGQCKFGSSCRNRHVSQNAPKQSSPLSNQSTSASSASTAQFGFNADSIKEDLQLPNLWPLSSFGPDKSVYPPKNILSGFDVSPEELRWEFYKDRMSTGTINNYLNNVNALINQIQQKKQQILQNVKEVCVNYMQEITNANQIPQTSAFSNTQSAFAQNNIPSVFGQSNSQQSQSVFGSNLPQTTSVFGQPSSQSVFGGPSAFTSQATTQSNNLTPAASSVFGQSQNVFQNQPSQQAFGQSAFGQTGFGQSSFGQTGFGQNTAFQAQPINQMQNNQQTPLQNSNIHTQQLISSSAQVSNQNQDLSVWQRPFEFGKIPEDEPPVNVR